MSMKNNWWEVTAKEIADSVFSQLKKAEQDQEYRNKDNVKYMKLYGNYDLNGLKSHQAFKAEPTAAVANRVTMNIVQSMIDTVVSKVTKNKPRPLFLTNGGKHNEQRRAQKLSQFVEGQFQCTHMYAKSAVAFLDACIFGTGALKIFRDGSEIMVERVFIDEIKIIDQEAIYGEPRQLHQTKYIQKDVLKDMFPAKAHEIDKVNADNVFDENDASNSSEMVKVVESWRLPTTKKAKNGKHVITIEECVLHEEEYNKPYFPFVFFRWGLRPLGFFGQGLAEQLAGLQLEINKILRTIQLSMHLISIPKVFVEMGSKVVASDLDNKIGGIVRYTGKEPTPGQLGHVPAELFNHLDRLYTRAFEIAGVSQLSATSAKPGGLNSGKALRIYNDLETERFMSVMQRYEQAFMDAATQMIELAKEISEEDPTYSVRMKSKNKFTEIKWKDVNLDEDKYVMGLFPSSALSMNPASRLEDVQELIQAGFVSQQDAIKLLDFPDLESFYSFQTASGADIDRLIEQFIDSTEYETPEPFQDLQYGMQKMQQAYLYYKSAGAPETNLELFRRWIEDAQRLLQQAAVGAQAEGLAAEREIQAQAQAEVGEQPIPAEDMPTPEEAMATEDPELMAMAEDELAMQQVQVDEEAEALG